MKEELSVATLHKKLDLSRQIDRYKDKYILDKRYMIDRQINRQVDRQIYRYLDEQQQDIEKRL